MADTLPQLVVEDRNKEKAKKKGRLKEKCTFLGVLVTIVTLAQGIAGFQWLVPYIYVTLTPVLVTIRIIMYWRRKWHFFLLDFCYYANTLCMVFLCLPDNKIMFYVVFSLSMGPLICAIPIYRNSLVIHDIDKVTSTYIHILPPLLSFVIRWYPAEASKYWFKPFMPDMPELSPLWLYLVPFIAFVIHSGLYSLVVNCLCSAQDVTVSSYIYLGEKKGDFLHYVFNCCGPTWRCGCFYFFNWLFCLLALIVSVLSYYSFAAHCLALVIFCGIAFYNGGSYYVHVFAVRGFVEELE